MSGAADHHVLDLMVDVDGDAQVAIQTETEFVVLNQEVLEANEVLLGEPLELGDLLDKIRDPLRPILHQLQSI